MTPSLLPVFIIGCALSAGLISLLIPEARQRWRAAINLSFAIVCLLLIATVATQVYAGVSVNIRVAFLPGIDLHLHVDALSMLFGALSGVLWLITTLYAIGYLDTYRNKSRFFGFFGLSVAATLGVAFSANLVTFVIFYEFLTLATFPLVAHKGDDASLKAAKTYLKYTFFGGAALLAGVVWLRLFAGPMTFTATGVLSAMEGLDIWPLQAIFVLIMLGLAVKAAIVPFHGWLPVAMAAPAPVSALLHAVAVVKAGAFGIIRVVYDVYGIELSRELGLTTGLAIFASITIVYGSVRAIWQTDIKKRLAYSTISQVSYIALGAAIAGPIATIGGMIHLVHQGLMKITLFFCAGSLAERLHVKSVDQLNGTGRAMPATMTAFTIAALGMIGVPPAAGFVSKWYLSNGAIEVGAYWVLAVLALSSLLNAIYFLPLIYRIWFRQAAPHLKIIPLRNSWMLTIPPTLTAALSLVAGVAANAAFSPLNWAKLIAAREYGEQFTLTFISETAQHYVALWIVVVPLLWLSLALLKRHVAWLTNSAWLAALPAIGAALWISPHASDFAWLFFGTQFQLDSSNREFLLLAGILWAACLLFASGYFKSHPQPRGFFIWSLLAMAGNFGLILTNDLFAFITLYTLMSLASYGMIVFSNTRQARLAGSSYIRWAIAAELLLFAGFSLMSQWQQIADTAALTMITAVFLFCGFGIKLGVFGLHFWLPLAHPAAPVPASGLLSGIMVKAGLLGIIKFVAFMPTDLADVVVVAGAVAIVFAVVAGLLQRQAKAVLAYSTISQMGIVVIALGSAVTQGYPWQLMAGSLTLFAFHHGITKAALFLSVGLVPPRRDWKWYHWALVVIPSLSIIGLPLTSAAVAKSGLAPLLGDGAAGMLVAGSVIGTTLLMLHFVLRLRVGERGSHHCPHWQALLPGWLLALAAPVAVFPFFALDSVITLAGEGALKTLLLSLAAFLLYPVITRVAGSHQKASDAPSLIVRVGRWLVRTLDTLPQHMPAMPRVKKPEISVITVQTERLFGYIVLTCVALLVYELFINAGGSA